jgi:hypothetical protein
MREILFRGKCAQEFKPIRGNLTFPAGVWLIGDCRREYFKPLISGIPVIAETVGEYTGLKDRNGKMIFEGDIVSDGGFISSGLIAFHQDCTAFYCDFLGMSYSMASSKYWEVIGNIHDNPELLEGGLA